MSWGGGSKKQTTIKKNLMIKNNDQKTKSGCRSRTEPNPGIKKTKSGGSVMKTIVIWRINNNKNNDLQKPEYQKTNNDQKEKQRLLKTHEN